MSSGGGHTDDYTRITGYILSTGDCSSKVKNGGWSAYGACQELYSCQGLQYRTCTNPAPAFGGANCPDHANAYTTSCMACDPCAGRQGECGCGGECGSGGQ